jgi:hypothetical protein
MQSVSSGYTIVEVIIFLAISGALLISSIAFLSGTEGHNRFSQSMRDSQSKIQDLMNDIPTGFSGGTGGTSGQAHCFSTPGKIQIDNGPARSGNPNETNGDCIFLGKAIQFTDVTDPAASGQAAAQESQIFVYSIFGIRTITLSSGDIRPVANLKEASPFVAVASGSCASCSGTADLTEEYTITGGAKVKKIVKSSGVAGDDSHLAGFFLSFNQLSGTSSGSSSLQAFQYPIAGNHIAGNVSSGPNNDIDTCTNLDQNLSVNCKVTAPATSPPPMSDWEICFENDSNGDTAVLSLRSVGGLNVTTKLEFTPC